MVRAISAAPSRPTFEDPIAERIIKSYVDPFSSIKATCEDGKIKLETV